MFAKKVRSSVKIEVVEKSMGRLVDTVVPLLAQAAADCSRMNEPRTLRGRSHSLSLLLCVCLEVVLSVAAFLQSENVLAYRTL